MSDWLLGLAFVLGATISLGCSWLLVTRLERVGARLGLSEGLLGMLAALAADAPEITAAVTALVGHDHSIGAGVVLGSNVFNLAALLGLAAIVAGRIALHRRVIELGGAVALWICAATVAVAVGAITPLVCLLLVLLMFIPYAVLLGLRPERLASLRMAGSWTGWLAQAIGEEELELEAAFHPRRGEARDALVAALAVALVVGASIAMERTAAELGSRHAVPSVLVGALVLACVTSLPNAVAAVYLASRGRGAAALSTALNSNALNVLAGLLAPATLLGLGASSAPTTFAALSYAALTALALALAHRDGGLRRRAGIVIVASYVAFVGALVAIA